MRQWSQWCTEEKHCNRRLERQRRSSAMKTECHHRKSRSNVMIGARGLVLLTLLFSVADAHGHQCSHDHHNHDHHHEHKLESDRQTSKIHRHEADDHDQAHGGVHLHSAESIPEFRLPEEIHEERELKEYGFDGYLLHHSDNDHDSLSGTGLWLQAIGSSLLVSSASLVCLIILPLIVSNGQPARGIVDALASFGAGTMLGDAFLHQLPHAFGGSGHSHSEQTHDHAHSDHAHQHAHDTGKSGVHSHGHSMEDLSAGLAVLGGILLFFLIEKIVRRAEELSVGNLFGHSHHHHKSKKDDSASKELNQPKVDNADGNALGKSKKNIRKRTARGVQGDRDGDLDNGEAKTSELGKNDEVVDHVEADEVDGGAKLVFGYLNLFSDAVHNFTDGMALGSAFLLYGTVGGWSRTLFLLAHELPQEVGDFGILVRSGFGVFSALAFNFLSALVALAGTALALLLGGSAGNSSIIEGFTAGGFIYIAVGSVMPDMHSQGCSLRTTLSQLSALIVGMGVAVAISLAE